MKKILLTAALLSSISYGEAWAQSYNPNYPSNTSYNYTGYNTPQKKQLENELKKFSIGFDYVFGDLGLVDGNISVENPLPGGASFETKTSSFDTDISSLNGNIGFRPFRYFGIEAFYQKSLENNEVKHRESYAGYTKFAQAEYSMKYEAYGIDALVYIPVTTWLEFLGTVGYAKYEMDAELKFIGYTANGKIDRFNPYKINESKSAIRYGAGAQIWLSKRLAFRAMYRYADIGGEFFEDLQEVSLGVRYNF